MPYSQYSINSLVNQIAGLQDDPTFIQWKFEEIRYGVIEALRYWGCLTSYWRQRGGFNTQAAQPWYDLSVNLPTLRPRTVTFNDIVTEIDYHLFELPGGLSGDGLSSQFDIGSITNAVVRARNRLVLDAGLPLAVSRQAITAPPGGRFYTNQDFVYLRHAYWQDTPSGAWAPLRATDAWAQDGFNPLWTLEPDKPFAFSQSVTRPLEVQLYPAPLNPGTIEWLTANAEDYADGIDESTLLGVPDEFSHAIKYAALADLFTMDGEASDPARADYCDRRYQQSVAVARDHKSIARVEVNGVPLGLSTLTMIDNSFPFWRMTDGRPMNAGCDLDMLAFSPVPNGAFGVTCDVLASAPIPPADDQFLQIGREFIPTIIDYVQHYLSFKLAGVEFFESIPMYDGFMTAARDRNAIQAKQIKFMAPLYGMPGRENTVQMGATTAGTGRP